MTAIHGNRVFEPAPTGFDQKREGIASGKIETVEYHSSTVGNKRKAMIYTPPGFAPDQQYNVLYLLHGIGGDEMEWYKHGIPHIILDNLYTDGKIEPMIVVLPNGRAMANDRAEGDIFSPDKIQAFLNFEQDLIQDLIPYVEAHYPVLKHRENRALAGLSMGGGQTMNIGLAHLDLFAWLGAFSSAPNTKEPELLVPDPQKTAAMLKQFFLSCGNSDKLKYISDRTHAYLEQQQVPHIWYEEDGDHDFTVWRNDLYQFSQLIFRS